MCGRPTSAAPASASTTSSSGRASPTGIVADGWTTHACVNAATLRPTRMPAWLAEGIAAVDRASRRPSVTPWHGPSPSPLGGGGGAGAAGVWGASGVSSGGGGGGGGSTGRGFVPTRTTRGCAAVGRRPRLVVEHLVPSRRRSRVTLHRARRLPVDTTMTRSPTNRARIRLALGLGRGPVSRQLSCLARDRAHGAGARGAGRRCRSRRTRP